MRAVLHRLLARYGQTVTLEREAPEEVRAFLQPLSGRDEMATMTTLVALVVVLMIVVQEISSLFDLVETLFDL